MPGDPLRAKFIAERFFDRPELVTSVSNMLGFTSEFRGRRVSVKLDTRDAVAQEFVRA
jgi:purine-nucleoside phosphorylase